MIDFYVLTTNIRTLAELKLHSELAVECDIFFCRWSFVTTDDRNWPCYLG